ncbi:MAG: arylesterase [Bacteriovoracaceae bacterium]
MKVLILLNLVIVFTSFARGAEKTKIVIIGDSLTAGYGISKEYSYPAMLEELLNQGSKEKKFTVVNGGVSGSTTANSLARIKWFLKAKPDFFILALGANDGLRGVKIESSKENLSKAIEFALNNKVPVILAGMKVPPNYGKKYQNDFEKIYTELAKKWSVPLIPFLIDGVAGEKDMNIEDGIHPNEKGHKRIAKNVLKVLKTVIK